MKFKEDSYMGWEAHFLYPFGMYVAWQIGFLIMTGNFFLKLDEILFPDKNCPNFYLQKSREYFCGFFVHFFILLTILISRQKLSKIREKFLQLWTKWKLKIRTKLKMEKKKENWEKYWKLDKKNCKKISRIFGQFLSGTGNQSCQQNRKLDKKSRKKFSRIFRQFLFGN